jgi:hypothetical protein
MLLQAVPAMEFSTPEKNISAHQKKKSLKRRKLNFFEMLFTPQGGVGE